MMKQEALQPGFHGFTELVILKVINHVETRFDNRTQNYFMCAGAPGAQGPGEGRGEGGGSLCGHYGWSPPH